MPVDRQGKSRFSTLKVKSSILRHIVSISASVRSRKGAAQLLDFPKEVYHTSANAVLTLMLQTYSVEKRVRVCQMWPRADSESVKRTSPYVISCPRRARSQMARYHASAAVFTGVGLQH